LEKHWKKRNIILHNLPSSYHPFIRGLDKADKILTICVANLTAKLLQEERGLAKQRESSNDENHALVSKGESTQYTNKFNDNPGKFSKQLEERKHPYRFNNNCHYCGKHPYRFNNNCHYCGKPRNYVKDYHKKKWEMQQRQHKFSSHKNSIREKCNSLCIAYNANVSNKDEWVID